MMDAERWRLAECSQLRKPWKKWGPYLSERQWGTVREDYSDSGNPWDYFSHDQARSRAYRWGEDGIGGISDDRQLLCFALALWNGKDPILKERIFGLTNTQGNHGEDCKEYYFYLDNTPTHSYMKYLYKYPHAAYPYEELTQINHFRTKDDFEYELIDTGVFRQDRYFDVYIEYAKESSEDILIQITAWNRGPEKAPLHLLPTLWFRNTWYRNQEEGKPVLKPADGAGGSAVEASHQVVGSRYLYCDASVPLLFTDNETNLRRIFGSANATRYLKDGINNYIVGSEHDAASLRGPGTKVAPHYHFLVDSGEVAKVRLRLTDVAPGRIAEAYRHGSLDLFGKHFDDIFRLRRREADQFYESVIPSVLDEDERLIMRQALAGMLWSKQYYEFDVETWLEEHGASTFEGTNRGIRNAQWFHMTSADVISMPDKWEYPWFAAWDLAFHTLALSLVDPDFAFQQLDLMLRERYLHPNGQIPAYEWNFSDVNPPVHAWACIFNYRLRKELRGEADTAFLKHAFEKLLMNFTWWLNRRDHDGANVVEGGFVGLDHMGVIDRGCSLPAGGSLEQTDGISWMALFSQNMLEISLELALGDRVYESFACKFFEHFLWIASAMHRNGGDHGSMWDEEDGFFYDRLKMPDGRSISMKVRSVLGLLPLCASTVFEEHVARRVPYFMSRAEWFVRQHPKLVEHVVSPGRPGVKGRHLLALLDEDKLRRVLRRMLDESEFLSPFGIRSVSKQHASHPCVFNLDGKEFRVDYLPAESNHGLFGGNANWQGPIWMPLNVLIMRGLIQLYSYYGNEFLVECPTGSGNMMNLFEVSRDLSRRLMSVFTRDANGRRPVFGGTEKLQMDEHWRNHILFYEYFHGDNGAGLGASHQTGWTGVIARVIQLYGILNADQVLAGKAISAVSGKAQMRVAS